MPPGSNKVKIWQNLLVLHYDPTPPHPRDGWNVDKRTNGQTDRKSDSTRCPWWNFQAGDIKMHAKFKVSKPQIHLYLYVHCKTGFCSLLIMLMVNCTYAASGPLLHIKFSGGFKGGRRGRPPPRQCRSKKIFFVKFMRVKGREGTGHRALCNFWYFLHSTCSC